MDEKRYPALIVVTGERGDIGDVGVLGCCQPGLCLCKSLPGCLEILVLVERNLDCVGSRRNVQRSGGYSGVEINRGINREPKSVRERTAEVIFFASPSLALL